MDEDSIVWLVAGAVLALDLLFALVRASLVNARLPQMMNLAAQEDRPGSQRTLKLLERPSLRMTLRFSVVLTHFVLLAALLWQFTRAVAPLQSWQMLLAGAAAALLLPLLETTVEGIALRNPETWALRLTGIAQAIDVIFRPVGALMLAFSNSPSQSGRQMGTVTDDELKTWVEVGQPDGGSLDQGERQMIYSIFRFGDTLCREVMVPRIEVLALEGDTTIQEATRALVASGHSRIPVFEESIDNVVGMLYAKDLLRLHLETGQEQTIRPYVRPAYFVPESKKVDDLLAEMQSKRVHIAVVVDEYGGMAGLVTLEDIVEEIVGEIRDEYDQAEDILFQQIGPDEMLFVGRTDLDDLNELLGTHLTKDLADTVGGYLYGTLGHVPAEGEQVSVEGWVLTVEMVTGRRIRRVRARRAQVEPAEEKEANDVKR
jgi:CBS domain containing-hemolysin-like protein